jgi:hypothetical protein
VQPIINRPTESNGSINYCDHIDIILKSNNHGGRIRGRGRFYLLADGHTLVNIAIVLIRDADKHRHIEGAENAHVSTAVGHPCIYRLHKVWKLAFWQ